MPIINEKMKVQPHCQTQTILSNFLSYVNLVMLSILKQKIFGVSVHPKYGGWFGLRGVLIFKNLQHAALQRTEPPDVVPTDELRIELLNRFNDNWQDWTYRDIIPVDDRYSEEQKTYFATLPKNRKPLIEKMKETAVEAH